MMKPGGCKSFSVLWGVTALSFIVFAFPILPPAFADEGASGEMYYYIIREGDTLWDLSQRFYSDEWAWPLVWGKNDYIGNPHRIYPGNTIYLTYASRGVSEPQAPPQSEKPATSLLTTLRVPRGLADTSLLTDDGVTGAGWVLASLDGRELMAKGDEVYLEIPALYEEDGPTEYQVLRSVRKIRHPHTGEEMGTLFRMTGSVEVLSRKDPNIARAKVLRSQGPIQAGDLLYAGAAPQEAIYSKRAKREMQGSIVASLRPIESIAQHDVCFIDKGVLDGVEVGDTFWVLEKGRTVKGYGETGKAVIPDRKIAAVVVIHAEKAASTVLVTDVRREFAVGATVQSWTE